MKIKNFAKLTIFGVTTLGQYKVYEEAGVFASLPALVLNFALINEAIDQIRNPMPEINNLILSASKWLEPIKVVAKEHLQFSEQDFTFSNFSLQPSFKPAP